MLPPVRRGIYHKGEGGTVIMNVEWFRRGAVAIFGVLLALVHLYCGGYRPITADILRSIHVGFGLIIIYMLYPFDKEKKNVSLIIDLLLTLLAAAWVSYFTLTLETVPLRTGNPIFADIAISTIGMIVLFEATRRVLGMILPSIAIAFLLYALLGHLIPGALGHRGVDYAWLITHSLLSTEGVFGVPIGVSARFVFLFVLFAAALDKTGGGKFFLDLAYAILGRFRGGPAKVAVFGSALMGTMSGSAVANVAGTGCITIPLMKQLGYDNKSSGAIEAVASSGGLIMPPIMGAAAFIMSEFLGITYLKIIIAAAIPACLYYLAVFCAVDFKAARIGLVGLPADQIPRVRSVLKTGAQFIIPLLVLIIYLVISTPQRAAFWGFIAIIILYVINLAWKRDFRSLKNILFVMEAGSRQALPIITACAVAGVVVGVISLTGLGFMLTGYLMTIGGTNLLFVLIISMVTSIILGMGLPVTACYIVLAVLAAPAMVELGVDPVAAHLFIIYFGVLSGITPPVALAAYVGAGIAEAKPMSVAVEACKIGVVAFFLPYMFLYNPVLLLHDVTAMKLTISLVGAIIGCVAIAAGTQGYLLTKANWIQRILLVAGAVLLFSFKTYAYALAFACIGITVIWQVSTIVNERKRTAVDTIQA